MLKFVPIIIAFALPGCMQEGPAPDKSADTSAFSDTNVKALFEHLATAPQTYTVHASGFFVCRNGTRISTDSQTFLTEGGLPVTDSVLLNVRELFSKKEMILNNAVPVSTTRLMLPEGSIQLSASRTGVKLNIDHGHTGFLMPVNHLPSKQSLALYETYSSEDGVNNLNWLIHASSKMVTQQDSSGIRAFYPNTDPGPASTCTVYLTGPFNNSNTAVFLSMNGTTALTALHASRSRMSQTFVSHANSIPVGLSYTCIALCFDGLHFYHILYPIKMTANMQIQIPPLLQSNKHTIANALNAL